MLGMHFLEPVPVPLFESLFPSLQPTCWRRIFELMAQSLLLKILLSHHVQLVIGRQLCVARRLLSCLFADFISRAFFSRSAMRSSMSTEHRHTANDERG